MAVTLPYEFDTSGTPKLILRGVLGLLVVVVLPGILYSLFVSHQTAAAVQLLLVAAALLYFGRVFLRNLTASQGTITAQAVEVQPGRLYGIRLASPAGTFPLQRFKAIGVQRVFGPIRAQPRWHERVCLLGQDGVPDIVIAQTALGAGMALGRDLAAALNLPYHEEVVAL
jgi:hypothetical protein